MNDGGGLLLQHNINRKPAGMLAEDFLKEAPQKGSAVYLLNTHMAVESRFNAALKDALRLADILVADGKPISVSAGILNGTEVPHITGYDLILQILSNPLAAGRRVMAIGGTDDEQAAALAALRDMRVFNLPDFAYSAFVSDPTRIPVDLIGCIQNFEPDVVLVFLGCPKQEILISRLKGQYPAVFIGLGGALQLIAGTKKRAPTLMRAMSLEWLYRLAQDPRRLWKRYFTTIPLFLFYLAQRKFG